MDFFHNGYPHVRNSMAWEVVVGPCCFCYMFVLHIAQMLTKPVLKGSLRLPHVLHPALDAGDAVDDVLGLAVDRGVDVTCEVVRC